MSRPIKDGVSYWPFDVDMLDDKKFKLIRGEFGIKGAYIALVILNSVYKDNGYFKRWDDDDCYLMSQGVGDGCSPQLVNEVLAGCVRRGLFDQNLFQVFGILTSAGIQRRFFQMVKNSRNKIVVIKEYLLFELNDQTVSEGVLNKVVLKTVSQLENPSKTQGNPDNSQGNSIKESKIKRNINKRENIGATRKHFLPPTIEDVIHYCQERNNQIDPQRFFDYYESNGWVIGKGVPIKDWKACVRNWERHERNRANEKPNEPSEYEDMVENYIPRYKKGDGVD